MPLAGLGRQAHAQAIITLGAGVGGGENAGREFGSQKQDPPRPSQPCTWVAWLTGNRIRARADSLMETPASAHGLGPLSVPKPAPLAWAVPRITLTPITGLG